MLYITYCGGVELKITYKNNLKDYNDYFEFNLNNLSKVNKFLVPIIFLIGIIYECINLYYYYKSNNLIYFDRSLKNILIFSILAIIFLIFIKKILWFIFKLDFKLALKSNKSLFKEKSIELKEEYILYKIYNSKLRVIKYDKIKKVVETEDCIYIIRKAVDQSYIKTPIIPKNAFLNKDEKMNLLNLLENKIINDIK